MPGVAIKPVSTQLPVGPRGGLLRFHDPEVMRQAFDVTRLETARQRFANFVYSEITVVFSPGPTRTADGIDMFKRPNEANSPSVLSGSTPGCENYSRMTSSSTSLTVSAIASGERPPIVATKESHQQISSSSRKEYDHLSDQHVFSFWNEKLREREPWYCAVISTIPTFKTANFQTFRVDISYFFKHLGFLLTFSVEQVFQR